ncbi:MAG TPA: aspartate kinase [Candidatus Polarisedimenticolaceae bacterium]|nr:aspartate kinase [Candidatus Polarisedimenticolaceae bacterium]
MKFGGTSVADADRIRSVAEIVGRARDRAPLVVVSALAGVTDTLERLVGAALGGDPDAVEPLLADLERRHRWAMSGLEQTAKERHHLSVEIDGLFDQLRQKLRSIRILGERSPRTADAILATGETLSSTIVTRALVEAGQPATWVDPRRVVVTDDRFGQAEPNAAGVAERARRLLEPLIRGGRIPVLGGFVGATVGGETTTLGRGGSDTSAAVLGAALGADEIQIWTDVDGMMSADPRLVPDARPIERLSFAEATELAFYGARVLHPDCLAPAVRRGIPLRIRNSLRPAAPGTVVVGEVDSTEPERVVSVASRAGVRTVSVVNRKMRPDAAFAAAVLAVFGECSVVPELVVASELAVHVVGSSSGDHGPLVAALERLGRVRVEPRRAVICIVGSALRVGAERSRAVCALAAWQPELLALGSSGASLAAVVEEDRLIGAVRDLHRRYLEGAA